MTPVFYAAYGGNLHILKFLKDKGVNLMHKEI